MSDVMEIPENLPEMTLEDVAKGNMKDGADCLFSLNGKVYKVNDPQPKNEMNAGKDMTLILAQMKYDPKYGIPKVP
jgi:predicted heme/steroid binding protein